MCIGLLIVWFVKSHSKTFIYYVLLCDSSSLFTVKYSFLSEIIAFVNYTIQSITQEVLVACPPDPPLILYIFSCIKHLNLFN